MFLIFLVPTNKLLDNTVFDRVNTHIANFSWKKCLNYAVNDDRKKFCNVLFSSKVEIDKCKKNFCNSCCDKMVDGTNNEHQFLCQKQCTLMEAGTNKNTWESCIETAHPERSIYPYCDDVWKKDFNLKQRCKTDMCNLCCVSLETKGNKKLSDESVGSCYNKCTKSNCYI